ncbi:MAG: ATP synthase F1 subunit epsilon [Myxococcota bacterium]|nr:ATP synthase F1 subunit epsilon [Myxococcota bacterium]
MQQFNLSIVTPTGAVVDAPVDEVTLPGSEGEFGVLPAHQPALIMLGGGMVTYRGPGGQGSVLVQGGVVEVRPDSILVLTDRAVMPADADREAARALLDNVNAVMDGDTVIDDAMHRQQLAQRGYADAVLEARD